MVTGRKGNAAVLGEETKRSPLDSVNGPYWGDNTQRKKVRIVETKLTDGRLSKKGAGVAAFFLTITPVVGNEILLPWNGNGVATCANVSA